MATVDPDWRVDLRRISDGSINGLAVMLVDATAEDDQEVEVGRVAFVRKSSENPDTEFNDALEAVVKKAEQAADLMDECQRDLTRAREMAEADLQIEQQRIVTDAKEKMREVVGLPKAKSKAKKKFQ